MSERRMSESGGAGLAIRSDGRRAPRVLLYSHDTFGLGHLRRSRAIANALAESNSELSVLIVSGSPIIGSFEFRDGVDYVRVPGVVKLRNGDYTSLNLRTDLDEAVRLRESLIRQAVVSFEPDIIVVDKEPTGFRGEILPALQIARERGARIVLGVRDVLDDPRILAIEWERKGALVALERLYDEVWVYGSKEVYEPLAGLQLTPRIEASTHYVGYLRREVPRSPHLVRHPKLTRGPFLLVTTGGGGDGEALIDLTLSAYEADRDLPLPALIVFGPFIAREQRRGFLERIARLSNVDAIAFDAKLERLMDRAAGIVAMGGYNTFCEILSFDKPALIVPRTQPRQEQVIRARAATRLGLVDLLEGPAEGHGPHDPAIMAAALRRLPERPPPSHVIPAGLLDGLEGVKGLAAANLAKSGMRAGMRLGAAAE